MIELLEMRVIKVGKVNLVSKLIYSIVISIIISSFLQIADYRLIINDKLVLLDEIFVITFFIYFLLCVFNNKIYYYKKIKSIQVVGVILIIYLILNIVTSIGRSGNLISSFIAIKNFIFPILLCVTGMFVGKQIAKVSLYRLVNLINIFAIVNFILVLLGLILGWEKMTEIILGQPMYASILYSFSHSGSMFRVPGLFSDALAQGSFSFLVFAINFVNFLDSKNLKKGKYISFTFIGIFGVVVSTNRQVILGAIAFVLFLIIYSYRKYTIVILCMIITSGIFFSGMISNSTRVIFSTESMEIRSDIWTSIIQDMNIKGDLKNLFLGTGVDATVLGKVDGTIELVDNSYLLIIHDYGLIGLIGVMLMILLSMKVLYKHIAQDSFAKLAFGYCIYFIIRMLFHSSIVNTYDSYMFFIVLLIGLTRTLNLNTNVKGEGKYLYG